MKKSKVYFIAFWIVILTTNIVAGSKGFFTHLHFFIGEITGALLFMLLCYSRIETRVEALQEEKEKLKYQLESMRRDI